MLVAVDISGASTHLPHNSVDVDGGSVMEFTSRSKFSSTRTHFFAVVVIGLPQVTNAKLHMVRPETRTPAIAQFCADHAGVNAIFLYREWHAYLEQHSDLLRCQQHWLR